MKRYLVVITILALVAVLVTGCTGAPSPITIPTPSPAPAPSPMPAPTATGNEVNFRLLISDEVMAIEEFYSFKINIIGFGVHQSGEGESDGWKEFNFELEPPEDFTPQQIDLTEVPGLDAIEVWSGYLDPGTTYDKMFIYVGPEVETPAIEATLKNSEGGEGSIVDEDKLKLPSNKLHINKAFTTPADDDGDPVNFVYDVTVVKTGNDKYILKPQADESGADKEFKEVPPSGRAGKSNVGHLYLREKDPNTWEIIDGGAWGKMKYNLSGSTFDFVFNGHGLEVENEYTLIYYPDPWPGNDLICLGSGTANEDGDVHIMGSVDTGDLPTEDDDNYLTGAKIWLVLSSDVDCESEPPYMIGWNPTEYLFEYDLITFDDTDE